MQAEMADTRTRVVAIEASQTQINERLEKVEKQMKSIEALLMGIAEKVGA